MAKETTHRAPEKQPAGRSKKAHMPPAPREAGQKQGGKPWGAERGDAGQFTGQGAPGLQKK